VRAIVLGSGPNGLVAAIALQRAGFEVSVLEPRGVVGGLAAGESVLGGPMHQGVLHDSELVRPSVLSAIGVQVKTRAETPVHGVDGTQLTRPKALSRLVRKVYSLVGDWMERLPPDIRQDAPVWPLVQEALRARRLGATTINELLRIGAMSLDDYAAELWEDPKQRALAMPPALFGTWMGPRSPTSVATLLLHEALRGREVVGGPAVLVAALAAAAPEVRTGVKIERIEVSGGRVRGVRLEGGEILPAGCVISTLGVRRTLLGLVPTRQIAPGIAAAVERVRVRGIHAKVHLVLRRPIFAHERVRVGEHPDELERAYDDARHHRMPRRPTLDVRQVGEVASIWVYGVSHALRGGWTSEARAALGEVVLRRIEEAVPGARSAVAAMEVLTPADLEARYGIEGGQVVDGELGLDQLWVMRPTAGLARYETGIAGLGLASDGMHPGVALTLVPGGLAVGRVLAGV
jgi:phytoene dehydrogenase-like protein